MEEPLSVLPPSSIASMFPVVYRQRIYFMSSSLARTKFILNPPHYLEQEVPRLPVPVRVAIVGPPKSGKTTGNTYSWTYNIILLLLVAERFAKEYGCMRLSIGEALRRLMSQFPQCDLTEQILSYLRVGRAST